MLQDRKAANADYDKAEKLYTELKLGNKIKEVKTARANQRFAASKEARTSSLFRYRRP